MRTTVSQRCPGCMDDEILGMCVCLCVSPHVYVCTYVCTTHRYGSPPYVFVQTVRTLWIFVYDYVGMYICSYSLCFHTNTHTSPAQYHTAECTYIIIWLHMYVCTYTCMFLHSNLYTFECVVCVRIDGRACDLQFTDSAAVLIPIIIRFIHPAKWSSVPHTPESNC